MRWKAVFAIIWVFFAAVNGRCDRNVISACYTSVLGSDENMQAQCAAYDNIKTCIAPHKDACAGDPTLVTITSLEQMCGSGGLGGDGDGGDPPNIQNECGVSKLMTCVQMLQNLVTENFEGFPSAQQINTVCLNFKSFKNCISPIERACGAIRTVQAQQIIKGIQAAVSLTDLMCGSEFKAGFLKHGMQCFDKKSFKNATRNKCASMMAPRPETSSLSPSPESKARECRRTTQMFECYAQQVGTERDKEAVAFVQEVKGRSMNLIQGHLGCQASGSVRLVTKPSVFIVFLLAAFFMY
ncbi:Hypothetical predicted protein [Mytilus galloprovincialis]|uniref:Uncharacterized protein n=1 Tax=Mytilus galloprovincialis TaxID=29158 RepID=A0A8B6F7M2_MYTGA|nr:Hypothetical predicted protein [Mytilus galloprovincialis]